MLAKSELLRLSQKFLDCPYVLGPCGEGPQSQFDQNPLLRWDAFDCVTYVNSILALLLAENNKNLIEKYISLNYFQSRISYLDRLHFTCVDWNPVVEALGIVKNITQKFIDQNGDPIFKIAQAQIDKPNWYRFKKLSDLKILAEITEKEKTSRLLALKGFAEQVKVEHSQLSYLPFNALFNEQGSENSYLFNQMPDCSIIEIIRPNWDLTQHIGTHLNISHLGFALRVNDRLLLRHASSKENKVVEVDLIEYLRAAMTIPSIKGIHVLTLL